MKVAMRASKRTNHRNTLHFTKKIQNYTKKSPMETTVYWLQSDIMKNDKFLQKINSYHSDHASVLGDIIIITFSLDLAIWVFLNFSKNANIFPIFALLEKRKIFTQNKNLYSPYETENFFSLPNSFSIVALKRKQI